MEPSMEIVNKRIERAELHERMERLDRIRCADPWHADEILKRLRMMEREFDHLTDELVGLGDPQAMTV